MNSDPRLPRYDDTQDYIPVFIQRFYGLWRELATAFSNIEQTHGEWTPVLTFATPGDLNVAYTTAMGRWTKTGKLVFIDFTVVTSTFTHTTAVGALQLTGLPFAPANVNSYEIASAVEFSGVTKAGYGSVLTRGTAASTTLTFDACGSGVGAATLTKGDTPTGGTMVLRGSIFYRID